MMTPEIFPFPPMMILLSRIQLRPHRRFELPIAKAVDVRRGNFRILGLVLPWFFAFIVLFGVSARLVRDNDFPGDILQLKVNKKFSFEYEAPSFMGFPISYALNIRNIVFERKLM